MELTDSRQSRCLETANSLQGRARRLLMARTVTALGAGGHRRTARALGGGPQDHAQRAPRTGERVHLPRGLCRTRSSAGGSLSAAPVTRYPHHDRSPKSSRSPVPSPPARSPRACGGSAPPTHRSQGRGCCRPPHWAPQHHHAQGPGLLAAAGGPKSAAKNIPATDALCDQGTPSNQAADAADAV